MSTPAELTLTVTKFTANPSEIHPAKDKPDENCVIDTEIGLKGPPARDNWKVDAEGQVFICPPPDVQTIAVKKKGKDPVVLVFKIDSVPGVPALRPIAIVFEQQKFKHGSPKALDDSNGKKNFEDRGVADNKLTVADHWKSRGPSRVRTDHKAPHWKFWIRVETTDPNSPTLKGWIDPTIENSEDMAM